MIREPWWIAHRTGAMPNSPDKAVVEKPASPTASAAKPAAGYLIGPADVVAVSVTSGGLTQEDFSRRNYTVTSNGTIAVPLVGAVKVSGMNIENAAAAIRDALIRARQFQECAVEVAVIEYHANAIKVQGAVRFPGNLKQSRRAASPPHSPTA